MVLKKSKCSFNSGVTQRFVRGFVNGRAQLGVGHVPRSDTVTVTLFGHEDRSSGNLSRFRATLEYIYDYLEWPGPDLSSFFDCDGNPKDQHGFNQFVYAKKQRKGCATLPDRIEEMINANVLQSMAEHVTVEINFYQCMTETWTSHNRTILSWKSTGKSDEDFKASKDEYTSNRKEIHNRHWRGVQRLKSKRASHENDTENEENEAPLTFPSRKIQIDIQIPHAFNASLVNNVSIIMTSRYCYPAWGKLGKLSFKKGCNYASLKEDKREALLLFDALEEDDCSLEDKENDIDDPWDAKSLAEQSKPTWMKDKSLSEYLIPSRKANVNRRVTSQENLNIVTSVAVNPASSDMVVRHPKGSCVYIDQSENPYYVDSDFQSVLIDTSESISDEQEEEESIVDNPNGDHLLQFDLASNVSYFLSEFIQLKGQLILPSEFTNQKPKLYPISDSHKNEHQELGNCNIYFGNSYPPTFVVRLKSENDIRDHAWFLIGKAFDVSRVESWEWQVQIGNGDIHDEGNRVAERFVTILETQLCTQITLQNIVEVFQESVSLDLSNRKQINVKPNPSISCSQAEQSPWLRLKHFVPDFAETVSVKEALTSLNPSLCPSTKPPRDNTKVMPADDPKCSSVQAGNTTDRSSPTVCDICFFPCDFSQAGDYQALALTPCGHVFCAHCWSSHVYIGLSTGDPIRCMAFDCKQGVNDAMLRSLAPGHMVNKWCQRRQHKDIERNLGCKWCPNTRCDKVAVVRELSTKINQFGTLVLCQCGSQWCFSCQTEPHWPASCQQIASFYKCRAEIDGNQDVPESSKVDYIIELKPCPKCRYPIERNEGCLRMHCIMCQSDFCWNCLEKIDNNNHACLRPTYNYVTYHLENRLVFDLPFKFFPYFLEVSKKRKEIEQNSIFSLQAKGERLKRKNYKKYFYISLQAVDNAVYLAAACMRFIGEVYTLLEPFYVVLSCAYVCEDMPLKKRKLIVESSAFVADKLRFIAWRLEEHMLCKRLTQIVKDANKSRVPVLLECGRRQMNRLIRILDFLQDLSKNIDISKMMELNSRSVLRYK